MDTFLTIVGFIGCIIAATIAIIKAIETLWFFKEFRDKTIRTLDRIEETLRNLKPGTIPKPPPPLMPCENCSTPISKRPRTAPMRTASSASASASPSTALTRQPNSR
jgi:hypothetical protein